MQVGVTQLVLPKLDTLSFLQQAHDTGYEVVELALRREGDLTLQTSHAALDAIRQRAAELNLTLASITLTHCTGNLLEGGEAQQRSLDETRQGLAIADRLGIRCALHTLGRLKPEVYYDDAYAFARDSLRKLALDCLRLNVTIAVEFVWNGFAFSPLEMRRLLDEVASEHVGFYFDPGNMAVYHFPHHWVKVVGKHIKMVHLKDWKGRALNGSWPALLEGEVDYVAMNRELRAIGYDGPMISEVTPSIASLEATAAAIRKIMQM